jgi:ribonuclease PH
MPHEDRRTLKTSRRLVKSIRACRRLNKINPKSVWQFCQLVEAQWQNSSTTAARKGMWSSSARLT